MTLKLIALCFVGLALGWPPATAARAANPVVVMETSMGTIKIELFEDKAPITVKNFLAYVDDKHYDGTIFHRVIDRTSWSRAAASSPGMKEKKTKDPIKNESTQRPAEHPRHPRHGPHRRPGQRHRASSSSTSRTTTSSTKANARDGVGYCVFGKVIEGMDVVDKIKAVKTATKGGHERRAGRGRRHQVGQAGRRRSRVRLAATRSLERSRDATLATVARLAVVLLRRFDLRRHRPLAPLDASGPGRRRGSGPASTRRVPGVVVSTIARPVLSTSSAS